MKNSINAIILTILICIASQLIVGCGPSQKSNAFNSTHDTIVASHLKIHYSLTFTSQERTLLLESLNLHWTEFIGNYSPITTLGQNQYLGNDATRRVFIHDAHHINGPYANGVSGWSGDASNLYVIHVIAGDALEIPELMHMLIHSYKFPDDIWDQQPTSQFWDIAKTRQKDLINRIRISRGFPQIP